MTELPPAKITDRFLAYVADLLPFFAGYFVALQVFVVRLHLLPNTSRAWTGMALLWLALYLGYQVLGNRLGATVGKRLFGIRVVDLEGRPLSLKGSVLRAAGYVLGTPLFNLGFLWSLIHPQSRAWHDLLAGSMTVETRPRSPAVSVVMTAASLAVLGCLLVGNFWAAFRRPTAADRAALRKAQEGLRILAAIEEEYRSTRGSYTDRLAELARASGDVAVFKQAMAELFDEDSFLLSAGKDSYRIQCRARDRRRSTVVLAGPSPQGSR